MLGEKASDGKRSKPQVHQRALHPARAADRRQSSLSPSNPPSLPRQWPHSSTATSRRCAPADVMDSYNAI